MIKEADLSNLNVLLLYPSPRTVSLVPPSLASFSALLKERKANVGLFDTSFYNFGGCDSDKIHEKNLLVHEAKKGDFAVPYKTTDVFKDLEKKIEEFKPSLILATTTDSTLFLTLDLFKVAHKHTVLTVMGGVFPTFAPERAITYPQVDIICIGEGEEVLLELCSRIKNKEGYSDILSLWIKKKDGTIIRNKRGPVVDINSLPPLDFSIFEEKRLYRPMGGKIYKMLPVETHRGCPYQCTYCASPALRKIYLQETCSEFYREKSIDKVGDAIKYYVNKWKPEYLFFWADTFFAYTEDKIDMFCDMYSKIKIPFFAQARPETITAYKIKRLKEVGLARLAVGIEHGNEKFRREILKRHYANSDAVNALEIVRKNGVSFSLYNMIGLPDETPELAMDTVELNRQIKGFDDSTCAIFQPYYGTPLRDLCIKKGYIKPDLIAPHDAAGSMLNMPQFSKERIAGLARTFSFYIRLPKFRWDEIKLAESFNLKGNEIWKKLHNEVQEKFFAT